VVALLLGMERAGRRCSQREPAAHTGLDAIYVPKPVRAFERARSVEWAKHPANSPVVEPSLSARRHHVAE